MGEGNRPQYYLLYEVAEKGSLDKFWQDDFGRERLSVRRRVKIALDLCTAMRFLHMGNDKVTACYHRDIKSANIVLCKNFTAQLTDCGLAKWVREDDDGGGGSSHRQSTAGVKGTPGYICPKYARGSLAYQASCDVFSFGIVLAELWAGMLQNHVREDGRRLNYYEEYIEEKRNMKEGLDTVLAFEAGDDRTVESLEKFAKLALKCMARKPEKRPTGQQIMHALQGIVERLDKVDASKSETDIRNSMVADSSTASEKVCSICRTFLVSSTGSSICFFCAARQNERKILQSILTNVKEGRSENQEFHEFATQKITGAMTVFSRLDLRINNPIPRLFILLPAEQTATWHDPKSWLRRNVQDLFHLYFVCSHTLKAAPAPIQLRASKKWIKRVAPALGISLTILKIASLALAGIPLTIPMLGGVELEVDSEKLQEFLGVVEEFVGEETTSGDIELMKSLKTKRHLSKSEIGRLQNSDSYELVKEKAMEQHDWRSHMVPVQVDAGTQWVLKQVAEDPATDYVVVE